MPNFTAQELIDELSEVDPDTPVVLWNPLSKTTHEIVVDELDGKFLIHLPIGEL